MLAWETSMEPIRLHRKFEDEGDEGSLDLLDQDEDEDELDEDDLEDEDEDEDEEWESEYEEYEKERDEDYVPHRRGRGEERDSEW